MLRIVEHVLNDQGLTELRFDMFTRASLSVSTGAYLEVERAIDPKSRGDESEKRSVYYGSWRRKALLVRLRTIDRG